MATIRPFMAIRPAEAYAKDVAALPYDVMNSEEAREMVQGKPWSFLHVDKAEVDLPKDIDVYSPAVYAKAKENLENMIHNGILGQDLLPNLYLYRMTMNGRSQTGLVCCTSVDEYINGTIKKHELTRADKEADRIRHVDTLNANTGPIFLAYKENKDAKAIIDGWTAAVKPIYDFVSEDGIGHTVWVIDSDTEIGMLVESFKQVKNLYIADGHHRNASAVKVALKRREAKPDYSYALTRFDFKGANNAGAIDIKPVNHALSYIRIIGGSDFISREFNFTGYEYLKELYLVRIGDSKVILDNCSNLETFATSKGIWKPGESYSEPTDPIDIGDYESVFAWPDYPESLYSLSDTGGLTILNCNNLKQISLENTQLKNFNFGDLPALEYVYLSSFSGYIVGGSDPYGKLLLDAVNTLPAKEAAAKGSIVLRGIAFRLYPSENETGNAIGPITPVRPNPVYDQIPIDRVIYNAINQNLPAKNWNVVGESGFYHPSIDLNSTNNNN